MKKPEKGKADPNREAFQEGVRLLSEAPGVGRLSDFLWVRWDDKRPFPREGWASVNPDGEIYGNARKRGTPQEWLYVLAHCALHLALGHFVPEREGDPLWNTACDCVVAKMLSELHVGTPPAEFSWPIPQNVREEERLYQWLREYDGEKYHRFSTMGTSCPDMDWTLGERHQWRSKVDWQEEFARGLRSSVLKAVSQAGEASYTEAKKFPPAERAKSWFISSYPLLGAVAAGFTLLADEGIARRMDVSVAAVCPALGEIYVDPLAQLEEEEWRFVLAHEFLHAALRHDVRRGGRDPELWNVACDFLINGWLMEMGVGSIPDGALYDPELKGMSAEAIYDQISDELRLWRKRAKHDLIWDVPEGRETPGIDLDRYYRSALQQGLVYHQSQRGYLPAGLLEEIHALSRPPIPWDVELARWFDIHFHPLEKRRTYARSSRRQSSTPDIPRPAWYIPEEETEPQMYGVVLDTSGSMDRSLLAAALGAVASYSMARNVKHVRVVFCDAQPYDQGIMHPEEIAGKVRVRGRGGTVLQPALELLDRDPDFPKTAPLLIITDGDCDRLNLRGREHAYLIPKGKRLPFPPKGQVFYLK